jgi:NTP pyrophosphatase (non-canonical NTP hydrolase)
VETLTGNEYQQLASRTINQALTTYGKRQHALFGMAAEVGELLGLYQKSYQGHELIEEHEQKEIGDILWMIAEYCTTQGWELDDIMALNIEKLKARYPEGFDAEHSLHRKDDDI